MGEPCGWMDNGDDDGKEEDDNDDDDNGDVGEDRDSRDRHRSFYFFYEN